VNEISFTDALFTAKMLRQSKWRSVPVHFSIRSCRS